MIEYEFLKNAGPIRAEDIADIRRILNASRPANAGLEPDRLVKALRDNVVLVAYETSSYGRHPIVGIGWLSRVETPTESIGIVGRPVVDPAYRDRGVAEDLIRRLMQYGLENGLERVEIRTETPPVRPGRVRRTSCIRGIGPQGRRLRKPAS